MNEPERTTAAPSTTTTARPWWRDAVVYQIYPRSFADGNGNGVGDLAGIRRHLDHLTWLGVDAVWLSPIYRSPMADFGYDVADHTDVDPLFGDLATFDALLAEAHHRGLRVVLDWIPNHTSDRHPWFLASRSSRHHPKRDWYVWRDSAPDGGPPNSWVAAFDTSRPAWTWDEGTEQWYLHLFLPEQPDLNWANPEVQEAQLDVLRFWLDRGVDGFRADVVHLIGKDPALADHPRDLARERRVGFHHDPQLFPLLERIRATLDAYPGERMMVGEINLPWPATIAECSAGAERGRRLHLAFDFALLGQPWDLDGWRAVLAANQAAYTPRQAWPTWALGNHDEPRLRTRYGSLARARAAAVVQLTLRGTPFVYAGDELGLADADIQPERRRDPGGRDGCRAPIPWDTSDDHGWGSEPWLPWPPEPAAHSVAAQRDDPEATLHLYRRLLAARRASGALRAGALELRDAPPGVLVYERTAGDDMRVVVASSAAEPVTIDLAADFDVEVASDRRGEGERFEGRIAPDRALLLRPA